jgi:hypothetical protein
VGPSNQARPEKVNSIGYLRCIVMVYIMASPPENTTRDLTARFSTGSDCVADLAHKKGPEPIDNGAVPAPHPIE